MTLIMETRRYVCVLIGVGVLVTLARTAPTDKQEFMLKILGSMEVNIDEVDHKTNNTEKIEIKHDSKNSSSVEEPKDNMTKAASDSKPAFGEGIGSNWKGGFNRGQGTPNRGLGLGDGFGQNLGGLRQGRFVDGYAGFGSPEVDGGGFIRQHGKGQRGGRQGQEGLNRGKGTNNHQIGGYLDSRVRIPGDQMGLPDADGCLCIGPNPSDPCCKGRNLRGGNHREQQNGGYNGGPFGGGLGGGQGINGHQVGQQIGGHNRGQFGGGQGINGHQGGQPIGGYHQGQFEGLGGGQGINGFRSGQIIGNFNGGRSSHEPKLPSAIGIEYVGPFKCPVTNGNYPHPTDCSHFLQCAHSVPYDTPCPEGLLYDASVGMCNWPDLVRCNTPTGTEFANQIINATLIIPSTWKVPWNKCRSMEVAVNAVFISVAQAVIGKPCPNSECQFPYIIVNCLR